MRGPLLFIFNFHPTDSYERYSVGVEEAGEYQVSGNFLQFFYQSEIELPILNCTFIWYSLFSLVYFALKISWAKVQLYLEKCETLKSCTFSFKMKIS